MDKAAAAFNIDPIDIRRRNLIDKFPYTSATGLVFDEASYRQTLEMAVKAIDLPAFRARQKQVRAEGRHLGIGFATFSERTGYGSSAFAARGMEITPGWENVIVSDRSVRLRRGAHRFLAARPGPAHHAGADHRRRDRRHAAGDQDRARRHRPLALRLGHLRQPLAGDLRRRHADRFAENSRQADQDRQPSAGGGARRHRAGGWPCQGCRHRPHGVDRIDGARRLYADASLQRRDRAGADRNRLLRSARHVFQRLPRRHRRGGRRDRPRDHGEIPGGGRRRPHHQSDDRRRPGAWRRGAGHRQRAAGGNRLRRGRRHPHRQSRRLHAADGARDPADRAAPHGNAERAIRSPRPRASAKAAPSARRRR